MIEEAVRKVIADAQELIARIDPITQASTIEKLQRIISEAQRLIH